MAIKIRCTECNKKVSIDEAFAGGMCRCPYCKAIVYVSEKPGEAMGARPASPMGRPDAPQQRPAAPSGRPEAPAPAVAVAPAPAPSGGTEQEHIPMARPVKIQSVITIILMALLLVMVVVGVALALMLVKPTNTTKIGPDGRPVEPETPGQVRVTETGVAPPAVYAGAKIRDLKITEGPVVYVVDGGSSMGDTFDAARLALMTHVQSLGAKLTFTILVCGEDKDEALGADYQPGGDAGKAATKTFLEPIVTAGAADLSRAIKAAIERKPKAIVLVSRKVVDDQLDQVKEAKKQGITVHGISIDGDSEVIRSMKALGEAGGGKGMDLDSREPSALE
jgi:phage FluMu protein Com